VTHKLALGASKGCVPIPHGGWPWDGHGPRFFPGLVVLSWLNGGKKMVV